LWRKVNRGLSAGRVQSPAIRLVVEREQERMAHVSAGYWDLEAATTTDPKFTATLQSVDGKRIATGKDFDSFGVAKDGIVVINEERANQLTTGLQGKSHDVRSVEEKPYRKSPKAPFMTSTLQQEGGNKLRITASEVMRLAQGLYEAGYITYMRTDAVILGVEALGAVRNEIINTYGDKFLAAEPRVYKSKVKNAQEATPERVGTVPPHLATHARFTNVRHQWHHGHRKNGNHQCRHRTSRLRIFCKRYHYFFRRLSPGVSRNCGRERR
jgi:DNA topoisomerase-1